MVFNGGEINAKAIISNVKKLVHHGVVNLYPG